MNKLKTIRDLKSKCRLKKIDQQSFFLQNY